MEWPSSQPTGSRQYKSRRSRPCDFCRTRKAACSIATEPPCDLCRLKGRPCTFVSGPGSRRRPPPQSQPSNHGGTCQQHSQKNMVQPIENAESLLAFSSTEFENPAELHIQQKRNYLDASMANSTNTFDFVTQLPQFAENANDAMLHHSAGDMTSYLSYEQAAPESGNNHPTSPIPQRQTLDREDISSSNAIVLDQQPGMSYRFVGPSGELDTQLIARREFNDSLQSASHFTAVTYQSTRPVNIGIRSSQPPLIFTMGATSRLKNSEPKLECGSLVDLREKFNDLVSPSFAWELIRLYFNFVHPSFPIISREQLPSEEIESLQLSFLAAICASSLPFIIYDDALSLKANSAPPAPDLFRISWTALQLESPDVRLCSIQTYLLILQREAREDLFGQSSLNWQICGMMLSNSQALGLNRDPTDWSAIKPWERRLRKVLWWAVLVTETWTAFGQGMPTHINSEDFDVPVPKKGDFTEDSPTSESEGSDGFNNRFYHLIYLTFILRDIMHTFFTVRALNETTGDLRMALTLARPLRERLVQWHQSLPVYLRLTDDSKGKEAQLDGGPSDCLFSTGSLRLSYLTAQVSLFRAMITPLATAAIQSREFSEPLFFQENDGATAVIVGAAQSAQELVKFIEALNAADWDSFWYSWSMHNFAIVSTFLMHLLILTQSSQGGLLSSTSPQQEFPVPAETTGAFVRARNHDIPSPEVNSSFAKEHTNLQSLTRRWRWALRLAERGAGGRKGLLGVSLRRIEALFREWQNAEKT
ncbi:unnamed protein product [Penicillium salamii]|uniref:Zn(2)-C6 fungal-type domain-containing protein n=1 Tax=Penicillium salamii TaxID=1612424 RepID=A0A9W4JIG8_9EURO|nr:unnamed protein product [Penicillium salamii]